MTTQQQTDAILNWLSENNKSKNIIQINQSLNTLAILSITLANDVSEAYALMNDLEDNYKEMYASTMDTLTATLSVAKAEVQADVKLAEQRKEFTRAKNLYKKLSMYLDRVERVADFYKQYVSSLKEERKFSAPGV